MYSADAYHPSERPTLKNRRLKVLYHLFMGSFRKTYAYLRMSALNCTLLNSLVAIKFASSLTVFSLRVLIVRTYNNKVYCWNHSSFESPIVWDVVQ